MTWGKDFLAMMPATCTLRTFSAISTDGYATRTYTSTSGQSVRCRVQPHRTLIKDTNGREITTSFSLYLAPYSTAGTSDTVTISVLDKLTLPAGFQVAGSCEPPIMRAYPCQDEHGLYHNEVMV